MAPPNEEILILKEKFDKAISNFRDSLLVHQLFLAQEARELAQMNNEILRETREDNRTQFTLLMIWRKLLTVMV